MITLKKRFPKNNDFLIAEKPVAVALIGGKEFFFFIWLEHTGFSENIFAMKISRMPLSTRKSITLHNNLAIQIDCLKVTI